MVVLMGNLDPSTSIYYYVLLSWPSLACSCFPMCSIPRVMFFTSTSKRDGHPGVHYARYLAIMARCSLLPQVFVSSNQSRNSHSPSSRASPTNSCYYPRILNSIPRHGPGYPGAPGLGPIYIAPVQANGEGGVAELV